MAFSLFEINLGLLTVLMDYLTKYKTIFYYFVLFFSFIGGFIDKQNYDILKVYHTMS